MSCADAVACPAAGVRTDTVECSCIVCFSLWTFGCLMIKIREQALMTPCPDSSIMKQIGFYV